MELLYLPYGIGDIHLLPLLIGCFSLTGFPMLYGDLSFACVGAYDIIDMDI